MYKNPGYAIIDIDKATLLPINYEIWGMDIDQANLTDKPVWEKKVDYVKDYKLDTYPSPDELWKLADKISTDNTFASVFKWNMTRNVSVPSGVSGSEASKLACMLKTSNTDEEDRCNGVTRKLFDDPAEAIVNFLEGSWIKKAKSAETKEYLQ
jgi:hypothetical protein